ncbi:DUF1801 domain-containing protein [Nonomuraea sp. NPDC050556]|uniref:DUF1801 domain-containing protein n=1 Tax=Nonomuraea sp. NPDC050556 TaxID=3364369 RepID=UPI0037ACED7B
MEQSAASVEEFFASVPDEGRRADARELAKLMSDVTGEPAAMWGSGIVGFGSYHYVYDSGHSGAAPLVGFAPRKQHLVVYLVGGFEDRYGNALERLGPHKAGKGCLYLKRLSGVDVGVLRELVERTARVHRGAGGP